MKILLMYSNHQPGEEHVARLQSVGPDVKVSIAESEDRAIEEVVSAEVIFGHRYLRQALPHAQRLRWVQSSAGGVDHVLSSELLTRSILLTRCPVLAPMVARHAHTVAWSLLRRIPELRDRQRRRIWDPQLPTLPWPRTALVLGFGSVGRELGKLLRSDGIEVWGVKRMPDDASLRDCDRLLQPTAWREVLPKVDLCFLTLPLNHSTKTIFDEPAMRALPAHAVVVNVGRGGTMDADALLRVLEEGHLGGVGLDVTDPMPPSISDRLWDAPRTLLTSYIASRYPDSWSLIEDFFERQLERYLSGQSLEGWLNPLDLAISGSDSGAGYPNPS
jgi:phosphoglycerate dehydrogenase-like enzyme